MVFKPVCCVCGQEIRPWHLVWMSTPGQHICIPCSEKEDPRGRNPDRRGIMRGEITHGLRIFAGYPHPGSSTSSSTAAQRA